jgi:glutamine synthetase
VKLADEIFYFKRMIREAALRHNCYATFMAKPIEGEPGSAMHIHHSVVDTATGQNIFSNDDGSESAAFLHFIGGMQRHLPSVIALLAPYVNSYRRYVRDFAAPINLEWGRDNRTTGLRVPVSDAASRRVENRLPGMDCNPYLGIAASLACGYLGLMEADRPAGPACHRRRLCRRRRHPQGPRMTRWTSFSADAAMADVLGPEFCKVYTEYSEFCSPWERDTCCECLNRPDRMVD